MNIVKQLKFLLLDQYTLYGSGGGKGGGSSKPDAPDPYAVAAATTQTNQATAGYNKDLNLNNYQNPFGSQQSQIVGYGPSGAPIYNTTISANPQLQAALGSSLGQLGNSQSTNQYAQGSLSNLAGWIGNLSAQQQAVGSQLGTYANAVQGLNPQYGALNQNVGKLAGQYASLGNQLNQGAALNAQQQGQDAAYKAQTQYLDPQFSQQKESLDAQLANQGLTPGSEAWNNAMTNYNNQHQQAYSNAQNQAILTGSQIGAQNLQNQISGINTQAGLLGAQGGVYGQQAGLLNNQAGLFGMAGSLASGSAGAFGSSANTAGQQAGLVGQQVGIGQLPYSNLQTIGSMIPGYAGPAQSSTSPANIGQNIYSNYQAQLNNSNAATASQNQMMGGLFGLGSAGLMGYMMSDRSIKRDIKRKGRLKNGLSWYSYRFLWDTHRSEGVMADEVEALMPHAVATHISGLKMVNYAQVL